MPHSVIIRVLQYAIVDDEPLETTLALVDRAIRAEVPVQEKGPPTGTRPCQSRWWNQYRRAVVDSLHGLAERCELELVVAHHAANLGVPRCCGAFTPSRGAAAPSRRRRDSFPGMMEVGGFLFDFGAVRTASGPVSRPSGEFLATAAERGRGRFDGTVALPVPPGRRRGLPDASPVVPRLARRRGGRGRHPNAVAPCSGARHAIDATRREERMTWVVSFSNLRPFGPSRATAMLRAGETRGLNLAAAAFNK